MLVTATVFDPACKHDGPTAPLTRLDPCPEENQIISDRVSMIRRRPSCRERGITKKRDIQIFGALKPDRWRPHENIANDSPTFSRAVERAKIFRLLYLDGVKVMSGTSNEQSAA